MSLSGCQPLDLLGRQAELLVDLLDQARKQRTTSELADDSAFGRGRAAHPSPRSAARLAAYWLGPPRKAAVPATKAVAPAAMAWRRGSGRASTA